MSDFIISEFYNFDDWDAAEEKEKRIWKKKEKGDATQGGDTGEELMVDNICCSI